MPSNSMQHWNGCQMAAIDIECTGGNIYIDSIFEIAIIPLDSTLQQRKDVFPFHAYLQPESDHAAKGMRGNRKMSYAKARKIGFPPETAADLLVEWVQKLSLVYDKYGSNLCRILPLGHNYSKDQIFIEKWLGKELYEDYFDPRYRDTMISALHMNDRSSFQAAKAPYPKTNLQYICSQLGIVTDKAHTAMSDALATAEAYRFMCRRSWLD